MTNLPQQKYQALTAENHDFIRRVAYYAADRLFQRDPGLTKHKNYLDREAIYHQFKSELRSLLTSPHEAHTHEIGSILRVMNNIDRLHLLKMRPNLIHNFQRLTEIMYGYIASGDKILFACFHLNLFANKDEDIYRRNVATINATLPRHVQKPFLALAMKQINRDMTRQWHALWKPRPEPSINTDNKLAKPRQRL